MGLSFIATAKIEIKTIMDKRVIKIYQIIQ